jgi:hypothetical protein
MRKNFYHSLFKDKEKLKKIYGRFRQKAHQAFRFNLFLVPQKRIFTAILNANFTEKSEWPYQMMRENFHHSFS